MVSRWVFMSGFFSGCVGVVVVVLDSIDEGRKDGWMEGWEGDFL